MKLVFLSNYYSHHQKPSCEAWYELTDRDFCFVATEEFSDERKQIGWNSSDDVPFVLKQGIESDEAIMSRVDDAETVILGSAPLSMIRNRLKRKKLVFKYSERVFKQGYSYRKWLPRVFRFWWFYGRHKSMYLLSASAYTAVDFAMHGTFLGKSYKWGYFPETKHYDIKTLLSAKKTKRILWCGRFLDWKHPDDAMEVAKRLMAEGYDFELDFIGMGELEETLRERIAADGLSDHVRLLGAMKPEEVREHMETAGIYLFTSDFREGWGAVLNESMNSGCAVVAGHAIGSVPFLLKHRENGLIYENGNVDDLYRKVKHLLDNPAEQKRLGENAYRTVVDLWNAETAAERFMKLTEEIRDHGYCDLYEEGPCSRARIIRNHWFEEDTYDTSGTEN